MRRLASCLFFLGLSGCDFTTEPTELPLVGTFAIQGSLRSNTCSYAAFPAENLFQREGTLRGAGDSAAKFQWTGENNSVPGTSTSRGAYQFATNANVPTRQVDPITGQVICTLIRHTQVSVTVSPAPSTADAGLDGGSDAGDLDAGVGDGGTADAGDAGVATYKLEGVYTEDLYPGPGSDCSGLLAANGGQFAALPCTVTYGLTGSAPR